jgi:hypothetical protein
MIYMYTSMKEVQPYFDMFNKIYWKQSGQFTLKQLDSMRQHGVKGGSSFPKWFRPLQEKGVHSSVFLSDSVLRNINVLYSSITKPRNVWSTDEHKPPIFID